MNSEEYEEIRNMTLLFFLEKLIDKGQARSLHDLSCQFGKKGFTKEMKQIAGNSQGGLKKFLLSYPFIFSVQGDKVSRVSRLSGRSNGLVVVHLTISMLIQIVPLCTRSSDVHSTDY